MILDELILHDFGVYAGRQVITLTPPSPNKPIILFGGLNGRGKTTLLDALQLVLFGPLARTSNRNGLAYSDYLARCIHRNAPTQEAAVELAFRHMNDGEEHSYRLHRSWRVTANGCKERFEVIHDGRLDPAMTDNWPNQVEDFIPANIAHLFLFDGEKVEGYAAPESSAAVVGTAIENLLGLDIVGQLEKDLVILERRKRAELKADSTRIEVTQVETELKQVRDRIEVLRSKAASLRTHKVLPLKRDLSKLEDQYRKLGGQLYDRRKEIEDRLRGSEKELSGIIADLVSLAAGALPLLLVGDLLASVGERDQHEEAIRRARDVSAILEERDETVVRLLGAQASGDKRIISKLSELLAQDRRERESLSHEAILLDLSNEARQDLVLMRDRELPVLVSAASDLCRRYQTALDQHNHHRLERDSIPNPDMIADLASKRDSCRQELAEAESEIRQLEADVEGLEREIERRQQHLSRLLAVDADAQFAQDDRGRFLKHSERVRETLTRFRRSVTERHVRRIEQLVLTSYQQLLRKTSLVADLRIDPISFSVTLFGKDGQALSPERLSAGERQLLAIALLWGLAKASGRPLPTAIDTPMGRLDSEHRLHLVERYFPFASHQVLLLSTDEEITSQYLAKLWPRVGRSYTLVFDDLTGSTTVQAGYFARKEAA